MTTTPRLLVADASSLILLCKTGVLEPLLTVRTVILPRAVYDEVCAPPLLERFLDARLVASLVADGRLEVTVLEAPPHLPIELGAGEAETIGLFVQEKADAVLTDDGRAIRACRLLGIPFLASPRIVVELARLGALPAAAARRALERLAVHGRYGPDVIGAAFERLAALGRDET
jgi:predicted nucleic acid-binding protein